jgi:hypothetical protein
LNKNRTHKIQNFLNFKFFDSFELAFDDRLVTDYVKTKQIPDDWINLLTKVRFPSTQDSEIHLFVNFVQHIKNEFDLNFSDHHSRIDILSDLDSLFSTSIAYRSKLGKSGVCSFCKITFNGLKVHVRSYFTKALKNFMISRLRPQASQNY